MREADEQAEHMFGYVSPEQRVPSDHPLRAVRVLTDEAVASLSQRFVSLYATTGRPSIPPEQLLRVLALQVLYTHYRTQSERLLVPARSRSEMRLICSSLSRLEIIKERSRLFTEDWNREVSRDIHSFATLLFTMLTGAVPPRAARTPETAARFAAKKRESLRLIESMPFSKGTRLGPYLIVSEIGHGGDGKIFLGRDTRLDRMVAIKAYLPGRLRKHETRAFPQLHHPHICTFLDAGNEHGVGYIVFEYLEGQTVAERVRKGPIPVDQVLDYAVQIAGAIQAMHRQGITHRDLIPQNVMLTSSGAKLIDFSAVRNFGMVTMTEAAKVKAITEELEKRAEKLEKRAEKLEKRQRRTAADAVKAGVRQERLVAHARVEAEETQQRQAREREKVSHARRKRRRALRARVIRVARCLLWVRWRRDSG